MNKKPLKALLRERRALIDPEGHGFTRPSRQGRRAPGLSQQQVDQILHRTIGTYHRLESGTIPNPGIDLLRDVARLFALNEQEWTSLCRYAGIGDPPGPLNPASGKEIPGVWQVALNGMAHMGLITDASWNVVTYNEHFADLFPNRQTPKNTMRWMLLDPQAREQLTDWKTAWAPLVLPQFRAGVAARPTDPVLRSLEKDVTADPDLAELWETGGAHIHPDGDERPLVHALHGPGWITVCAAEPMTAPGSRFIVMIFNPGERRVHPRHPMLRAH